MSKVCVLIHGYLTNYLDFQLLPKKLIEHYDQVILLCLPGHNHKDSIYDFKKDAVFKYIHKEMDQIVENNTVDVIGFSLGGALAWYIALNYKINKLVLLAPANNYINFFLLNAKIRYLRTLDKLEEPLRQKLKEELKQKDKEAIDFIIKNTIPKFNISNGFHFCKIINEINKNKSNINIPLLVIRGDLDELVPKKSADLVYGRCINENKHMYNIPDIGHMMLRTNRHDDIIKRVIDLLIEDK